jgi:sugar lactone lactonase YvrE
MKLFTSIKWWMGKEAVVWVGALAILSAGSLCAQPLLITTAAGYGGKGSADGVGAGALFFNPQGVVVDGAGNVYVADTGNNTIRVIEPSGVSSTLAGTAGVSGSTDGSHALFDQPSGLALDAATNLYVSDYGNNTIRQITPSGQVSTIAGYAGVSGSVNATGTNASFFHPLGLAVDSATNIYVADYGNHLIRKITPAHVVSTLAGSAGAFGFTNASGTAALFYEPEGVAVDSSGNVYVADTGNALIRLITSAGVVSTFAGYPGSLGSTDGTGTNALFYQPTAIAINNAGTLFVADGFNNTLRQISPAGTVLTVAGMAGSSGSVDGNGSSARFWNPQGVAASSSGTVYVADTANSTIRAVSTSYNVSTFAGSPSAGSANGSQLNSRFDNPRNVAADTSSNLYVADTQNNVIRKITPLGVVSILAGTPGISGSMDGASALFAGPQGLTVDTSGNVYVADTGNSTIRKVTPGGTVSTLAGQAGNPGNADGSSAQFYNPQGVAVDASGNVYVADTGNHTIRKITAGGLCSTLAGLAGTFGTFDGTNSGARFNCPSGITVDGSGNVYVSDYNNNTIRKVTAAGVVTTVAGWPGIWGNAEGSGTNALFFGPSGIGVDGTGNLYVADSGNQTLRKITAAGVVSTVGGLSGVMGDVDGAGTAAEFDYPSGVAVDGAGHVFVADAANNTIRSQGIAPVILTQPQSQTNMVGAVVILSVSAYGSMPMTYMWQYNGTNLPTGGISILASNAGTYVVTVSNVAGFVVSSNATLTLTNAPAQPGVFQSIVVQANGTVQLGLSGTVGDAYTLDVSTNLKTWTTLATISMTNGSILYQDATASNFPTRFYRLVSP